MYYTDAILNGHTGKRTKDIPPGFYDPNHPTEVPPGSVPGDPAGGGAYDWGSSMNPGGQPTTNTTPRGTTGVVPAPLPGAAVAASEASGGGAPGSPHPVLTNIAGQPIGTKDPILPGVVPPISPDLQKAFMQYMQSQVGQGVAPYKGQLSPDINKTMLPGVWANWKPWNGPMIDMSNNITHGYPSLNNLMASGMPTPGGVNPMQAFLSGAGAPGGYQTPTKVGN